MSQRGVTSISSTPTELFVICYRGLCIRRMPMSGVGRPLRGRCKMKNERLGPVCCSVTVPPLSRVRVAFHVPFRVRYGQSLRLVGSGLLGEWDLQKSLPMTWSDGDIWKTEVEIDLVPGDLLQYKYVVSNADGGVAAWKPGENIHLYVPATGMQQKGKKTTMKIMDTWDGAVHEVQMEVINSKEVENRDEDETVMKSTLKQSYEDLEDKLNVARSLVEKLDDPASKDMILADRELALAANKAFALTRAMEACNQQRELNHMTS